MNDPQEAVIPLRKRQIRDRIEAGIRQAPLPYRTDDRPAVLAGIATTAVMVELARAEATAAELDRVRDTLLRACRGAEQISTRFVRAVLGGDR